LVDKREAIFDWLHGAMAVLKHNNIDVKVTCEYNKKGTPVKLIKQIKLKTADGVCE